MPITTNFSIEDIVKYGKPTSINRIDCALKEAFDYATPEGIVLSMPELISAEIIADKDNHKLWNNWYTVLTEEDIGIDKKGIFVKRGKPVLLVVHGGGLLTPARIKQAYNEGLINKSARYTEQEFDELLEGKLPTRDTIQIYTLDEIKRGIKLPRRHAIALDYETIQKTISGCHDKTQFMNNPLVIARISDVNNLESYFDKAKQSNGILGNRHPFAGRNASQTHGRLLFLGNSFIGLSGNNNLLNYSGRFVGVAPEALVGAPEFIPGEGYVRKKVSLKQKAEIKSEKESKPDPFSNWINLVCLTDFQKTIGRKNRAELETLPDGERRKLFDKLCIAAQNVLEFVGETDNEKHQGITQAQQEALDDIAKRFKNLELD